LISSLKIRLQAAGGMSVWSSKNASNPMYHSLIAEHAELKNHIKQLEETLALEGEKIICLSAEINNLHAMQRGEQGAQIWTSMYQPVRNAIEAQARLYDLEHSRVSEIIKKRHHADRAQIDTLDVHMQDAQFNLFSYHIPAYIYESKIGEYANYKIINAHSGEIYGNKIYSILKSAIFGAGVGGGLTFAFSLATRPYILAAQMATRFLIGAVTSGLLSGTLAHYRNYANNFNFHFSTKSEKEHNAQHPESEEDIARREYADKVNKEDDYTVKSEHVRLPIDKCKLFGLNPENEITAEILKTAYHRKVKTWHPDMFNDQNSKKKAEAMTQQLNTAYKELLQGISKDNTPKNK